MLLSVLFIEPDLPLLVPVEEVELAPGPLAEVGESSRGWVRMWLGPLTCRVTHIFYVTQSAGSTSVCSVFCCIRLSARSHTPQNLFLFQGLICPKAIWNASKFPASARKRMLECCQQRDRRLQAMRMLNSHGVCAAAKQQKSDRMRSPSFILTNCTFLVLTAIKAAGCTKPVVVHLLLKGSGAQKGVQGAVQLRCSPKIFLLSWDEEMYYHLAFKDPTAGLAVERP